MWGTSSPDDKLTGDLTNVIEAISIDDRGSDCLAAGKLAPGNLGLFQQHRSSAECLPNGRMSAYSSGHTNAHALSSYVPKAAVSECSKQEQLLDDLVGAAQQR